MLEGAHLSDLGKIGLEVRRCLNTLGVSGSAREPVAKQLFGVDCGGKEAVNKNVLTSNTIDCTYTL